MIYLLQVQTTDTGLILRTECDSDTLEGLLIESKRMIRNNPIVKGMTYRVFTVIKNSTGRFDSKMIKQDTISL
jgi:hypothetical protein